MLNQLRHLSICFGLILSLLLPGITLAEASDQQSLFLSVEKSLKRGDIKVYLQNRAELEDYPLSGYLEYLYLSTRFNSINQKDINRFVSSHPDLPQASQLQYKWLSWLARKQRWTHYLQAYAGIDISGGRYQCLNGRALLATGHTKAAWQEAKSLWLVGKSQDKACDPLFSSWKKAGQFTQSLAAQRFWMAVANGKISLARYIDRSISKPLYKNSTKLFWRIHSGPYLLDATASLDGNRKTHRQIMLHGIKRLVSRDRGKALDIWLKLRNKYPFEQKQVASIDKRLAMKFAKNFTENAENQIARIDPDYKYPDITKWRIRLALAEQSWAEVLYRIHKLPMHERKSNRWSYWNAVALLKLNSRPQQTLENNILSRLSQQRSFYGFLVADLSNRPFQLNHETPAHHVSELGKLIAKHDGFARIKEWLKLKRVSSAQSELNLIKPKLTGKERKLLPYVARSFGWHHQAIMSAAREAMWNDLELRFPAPQGHLFHQYAERRKIDYPWVISVARQESAFNPSARSHAGARGLMQLMPATAKQAARKSRVPYKRTSELYKPETNIAIGTAHLAWLSNQFEGNKVFATAAYNAGGTAVRRWLRDRGHLPLDIWIETIPYDETRRYVQNVLAFRVIYSLRGETDVSMFSPSEAARLALTPAEQRLIASYP
ncbi:transglycosylase SLT domain-containing protein [Sansalvadorimonas sp. 2012CJ34-2]|uniref:Transglycosylase SLT domain-containing protein n=1 Tax=Parendozoicomonas callyspongiae TaxID=2942213 RepID=A0ABT0PF26_9GAMM|nr:transglycosylase SLT domain-containing protein [Sansalvadorimonas sp. 2012CJ34-2]MCL6269920.1 transglycosylase SLT domain-containing protein [Sansalvadorimonas sp. 2012CJ34-2]